MQEFTGPSLSNYLLVLGFLLMMLIGFYYLKKNKHVIDVIRSKFDLSPRGIREMLNLNKPIYVPTSAYGHFGREPDNEKGLFTWEKIDKKHLF